MMRDASGYHRAGKSCTGQKGDGWHAGGSSSLPVGRQWYCGPVHEKEDNVFKFRYGFAVLFMVLCLTITAEAQVSIGIGLPNVSIGINIPVYPELVPIPGYPVYYAPRVSANYFFYDGMYWVFQDNAWYASTWYNGPWQVVAPEFLPNYILRIPVRYYRQPPVYFRGWHANFTAPLG